MTSAIDLEYKPRLRHCTFFIPSQAGRPPLMVVGDEHFEITQEGADLKTFFTFKRYLDGRHTLAEICGITGVAVDDAIGIVASFLEQGLLRTEDAEVRDLPADVFLKQIDKSTAMWAEQIGYHRIWPGLENRDFRREVFLGLILETYHYINSASRHISTALAHCSDPAWRTLLSKYLAEEYDHAWMARDSLIRMGVPADRIDDAHPLIGTWSLVNNLCEISREDTLGYLACTKLFEARGGDSAEGCEQLGRLAVAYGYPDDCLEPLISHVEEDIAAEHTGLLQEALSTRESVPVEQAHRAVNNLHDLKHSYDQYYDNVVIYYSDIANYIPRIKVDYFSL